MNKRISVSLIFMGIGAILFMISAVAGVNFFAGEWSFDFAPIIGGASSIESYEGSVEASDVDTISVKGAQVKLELYQSDSGRFEIESQSRVAPMVEDETLVLHDTKTSSWRNKHKTTLKIGIPEGVAPSIKIEAASMDIKAKDAPLNQVDLEGAHIDGTFHDLELAQAEISGVDTNVYLETVKITEGLKLEGVECKLSGSLVGSRKDYGIEKEGLNIKGMSGGEGIPIEVSGVDGSVRFTFTDD